MDPMGYGIRTYSMSFDLSDSHFSNFRRFPEAGEKLALRDEEEDGTLESNQMGRRNPENHQFRMHTVIPFISHRIHVCYFTINIPPMLAYIPYMDPMGIT